MTTRLVLTSMVLAVVALNGDRASTQTISPTNSAPNPYRAIYDWAKMPEGRTWGSTSGVDIDPDGTSVWVAERCGAFAPPSQMKPGQPFACDGSTLDPILKFDASGKLVRSFGAGMFVFPHGLHVDRAGNVWVTDGLGRDGKGHQVFKFSPEGKVLLALGKPGIAGDSVDEFNAPSAVLVAPNGDIFVADGHGGKTNARIVKFSPEGKFIKSWGRKGSAPSEFDIPHPLRWIRVDGCLSVTVKITAFKSLIRMETLSINCSNSVGRAASSSTSQIRFTWQTQNRSPYRKITTGGNGGLGSESLLMEP